MIKHDIHSLLVHDCGNSIDNALELPQSSPKSMIWLIYAITAEPISYNTLWQGSFFHPRAHPSAAVQEI